MKLSALAIATTLFSTSVLAAPLTLQTYNPQENGIFAVNSTLASGPHEAVLFDAQFSVKDGEKLVEMIKKSGKKLTRIVITSGDPDFYFGLEPLVKAFPDVNVVATAEVVKHINATKAAKLAYWGPQMKDGAPKQVYNEPANMFVAGFIGSPAMNFIRGAIDDRYFVTETLRLEIPEEKLAVLNAQGYQRKAVVFGIRPEDILTAQRSGENITAKISVAELTGAEFMLYATVGGHELVVRAGAADDYVAGDNIGIQFDMSKCHFFDADTEAAIR